MDESLIQILVLAFIAAFVLFRLYATLGRRTGAERPVQPQPAPGLPSERATSAPLAGASAATPTANGLMAIVRVDPSFDSEKFVSGARGAYELIVGAFAKGDKATLQPLLTPRVYESYIAAIDAREAKGELGPELVRLRAAEIADAELQNDVARVTVKFQAELAEGAVGVRDAREKWTFERNVRSSDPNWRLARVAAA